MYRDPLTTEVLDTSILTEKTGESMPLMLCQHHKEALVAQEALGPPSLRHQPAALSLLVLVYALNSVGGEQERVGREGKKEGQNKERGYTAQGPNQSGTPHNSNALILLSKSQRVFCDSHKVTILPSKSRVSNDSRLLNRFDCERPDDWPSRRA